MTRHYPDLGDAFDWLKQIFHVARPIRSTSYNGGQKCWDLSSDITKTSDPSPSTPNKVEFGAKWVKMSAFFGHNIARRSGGGGRRYKPKAEQNIVLRSRVLRNNCLEGLFTQSQVLLSSIVDLGSDASSVWNFCASVITRRNQWWRREMSAFSG